MKTVRGNSEAAFIYMELANVIQKLTVSVFSCLFLLQAQLATMELKISSTIKNERTP